MISDAGGPLNFNCRYPAFLIVVHQFTILLIICIMKISKFISKKYWLPKLVDQYKSSFEDRLFDRIIIVLRMFVF